MINAKLQDFATGAMARGQISFGDVRRLQRDCLPHGIATREDAETLIALDAALARADKAWAAWLVPALADFVAAQQRADASTEGAAGDWLQALFARSSSSAALGRKIARHMRRLAQPVVSERGAAPPRPRRKVRTCKVDRLAARIAPAVQSDIAVSRGRGAVARLKRRPAATAILPCEVWAGGLLDRQFCFQLARPAA